MPRKRLRQWVGFDLDSTLAIFKDDQSPWDIGEVIPLMRDQVFREIEAGFEVKIFTARVCSLNGPEAAELQRCNVQAWCLGNFGQVFEVTNEKDWLMARLYDDRSCTVEANTGKILAVPSTEWIPGWIERHAHPKVD